MKWTGIIIYQSTSVLVEIKAIQTVSFTSRSATCTIVSGAIIEVGYGNLVVKDSCMNNSNIININIIAEYQVTESPMLALLTTVTTRRKNGKKFKGMQVATISNYNIMEKTLGIRYCHLVKNSLSPNSSRLHSCSGLEAHW